MAHCNTCKAYYPAPYSCATGLALHLWESSGDRAPHLATARLPPASCLETESASHRGFAGIAGFGEAHLLQQFPHRHFHPHAHVLFLRRTGHALLWVWENQKVTLCWVRSQSGSRGILCKGILAPKDCTEPSPHPARVCRFSLKLHKSTTARKESHRRDEPIVWQTPIPAHTEESGLTSAGEQLLRLI